MSQLSFSKHSGISLFISKAKHLTQNRAQFVSKLFQHTDWDSVRPSGFVYVHCFMFLRTVSSVIVTEFIFEPQYDIDGGFIPSGTCSVEFVEKE